MIVGDRMVVTERRVEVPSPGCLDSLLSMRGRLSIPRAWPAHGASRLVLFFSVSSNRVQMSHVTGPRHTKSFPYSSSLSASTEVHLPTTSNDPDAEGQVSHLNCWKILLTDIERLFLSSASNPTDVLSLTQARVPDCEARSSVCKRQLHSQLVLPNKSPIAIWAYFACEQRLTSQT